MELHEIKYNSIVLLCQKIKNHFKCEISIFIYGSYSTGLELEESDIDLSVELIQNNSNDNNINKNIINKNNLNQKTIPELINELIKTKIPILKMIILQNNIETKIDLIFKYTTITINYYNTTFKRYP